MEDRVRRLREVLMWDTPAERVDSAVWSDRRNVWPTQPAYVEGWLEKDALSGIFEHGLRRDGVMLNVGRGYDGWGSTHQAAQRDRRSRRSRYPDDDPRILEAPQEPTPTTILSFGDFAPSGEDLVRSLGERLRCFDGDPAINTCAFTADDGTRSQLPPDFTKATDTRRAAFVEQDGDIAVELDALPSEVLAPEKARALLWGARRPKPAATPIEAAAD